MVFRLAVLNLSSLTGSLQSSWHSRSSREFNVSMSFGHRTSHICLNLTPSTSKFFGSFMIVCVCLCVYYNNSEMKVSFECDQVAL